MNNFKMFNYAKDIAEPRLAKFINDNYNKKFNIRAGFAETDSFIDTCQHTDLYILKDDDSDCLKNIKLRIDLKAIDEEHRKSNNSYNYSIPNHEIEHLKQLKLVKNQHSFAFEEYDDNGQFTGTYLFVKTTELLDYIENNNIKPIEKIDRSHGKLKKIVFYLMSHDCIKSISTGLEELVKQHI